MSARNTLKEDLNLYMNISKIITKQRDAFSKSEESSII
jgi:hypothetical protein